MTLYTTLNNRNGIVIQHFIADCDYFISTDSISTFTPRLYLQILAQIRCPCSVTCWFPEFHISYLSRILCTCHVMSSGVISEQLLLLSHCFSTSRKLTSIHSSTSQSLCVCNTFDRPVNKRTRSTQLQVTKDAACRKPNLCLSCSYSTLCSNVILCNSIMS